MDGKQLTDILISWFPMLLLIAVWIFFMRTQGKEGLSPPSDKQTLEEMQRQTKALERIAASLERRRD